MPPTGRHLALILLVAVAASRAEAQHGDPPRFVNARFDLPLGLLAEGGVMLNELQSEAIAGPAIVLAAAQHGGRVGVGYRMTGMMGMQVMTNGFFARTWNAPIGVPPKQGYLGADLRVGMLFTTLGAGALLRVAGNEGPRLRLTASVGIGL
jgi:hypothetical protein